ncbi:hypothetical protein, partial [Flavobacterium caeni]|uniref:hypothetical protein n=1 Tax=Flavobacterium caeni TaxID=490189 RepID=UPI001B8C128A
QESFLPYSFYRKGRRVFRKVKKGLFVALRTSRKPLQTLRLTQPKLSLKHFQKTQRISLCS